MTCWLQDGQAMAMRMMRAFAVCSMCDLPSI
eukprot:CAMPEP_0173450766 /NCGR_PEP_ID=MMETSP1357-20121228/45423_1 /TAXON_ID=77926 /ORGANISM="Hemiselmis rufescens, Strain PCC563" /LENGTH=30 /DNA_ID= /DNA_START= /DNA_END= /DNA_ORIENTATION=